MLLGTKLSAKRLKCKILKCILLIVTNHEFSANFIPPLAGKTLIYTFITFRIDHCKIILQVLIFKNISISTMPLPTSSPTPGNVNTLVPSFRSFTGSPSDPIRSPSSHQQTKPELFAIFPLCSNISHLCLLAILTETDTVNCVVWMGGHLLLLHLVITLRAMS